VARAEATRADVRTSEPPRLRAFRRAGELFRHRELIGNLTGKELKVKYKSTALGVVWSMLNPLLYLVVFWLVFTVFLPSGIPDFAIYLLSGLLGYTLFSTGLQGATSSVVESAALVTKVAFPREILPLSAIGASLVNFFYQFVVLVAFMLVIGHSFLGPQLVLAPAALAVLLLFLTAIGMGTAATNVRYRDTRHLVELSLIAWFWVTPVVYSAQLVLGRLGPVADGFYLANPLTAVTLSFQRALYGYQHMTDGTPVLPDAGITWYAIRLGMVALASLVILYLTWRAFFRMSGDFAEEL